MIQPTSSEAANPKAVSPFCCPECGASDLITDEGRGEVICTACGIVLEDHVTIAKHERAIPGSHTPERTGSPLNTLLPDRGMSTLINAKQADGRIARAARWQTRLDWPERNLFMAINELKRLSEKLNLGQNIKEMAIGLYRKAFKAKLLRGRSINSMITAALYAVIREQHLPVTFKELVSVSPVARKDIQRSYRALLEEFKLNLNPLEPTTLLARAVSDLGLDYPIEREAKTILEKYTGGSGKDPKGWVAAAIYLACRKLDRNRSQSVVARTVGVTEVTLRSRFKDLCSESSPNGEK
jgi:transcription initiation factor TFIIB